MRYLIHQLVLLISLGLAIPFSPLNVTASAQAWPPHLLANTTLRVDYIAGSEMSDPVPPDGSNWGSAAFKYLRDAIDKAVHPLTPKPVAIWVRGRLPGDPAFIYRPDEGANVLTSQRGATFMMANDVRWYGGFAGDEPLSLAGFRSRDPVARPTVLSGEIGDPQLTSDNTFHVVTAVDVNSTSIIDGFIITRGNANNNATSPAPGILPIDCGGGMLMYSGKYVQSGTRSSTANSCRSTDRWPTWVVSLLCAGPGELGLRD